MALMSEIVDVRDEGTAFCLAANLDEVLVLRVTINRRHSLVQLLLSVAIRLRVCFAGRSHWLGRQVTITLLNYICIQLMMEKKINLVTLA
jgi:hypothetical protein